MAASHAPTAAPSPHAGHAAATDTPAPAVPPAGDPTVVVTPTQATQWLTAGQAVLFDVREPDEHAREHIPGAVLVPLSTFDVGVVRARLKPGQRALFHCKSGKRSQDACRLAGTLRAEGITTLSVDGGIEAWKSQGLPVRTSTNAPAISIMRQVQLVVGVLLLGGAALAWLVHPAFIGLSALLGAGLAFAGATGTCGLAFVLAKMPWNAVDTNKAQSTSACCSSGSC